MRDDSVFRFNIEEELNMNIKMFELIMFRLQQDDQDTYQVYREKFRKLVDQAKDDTLKNAPLN